MRQSIPNILKDKTTIISLIIIVLIIIFFRSYQIPSASMLPTILEGDRIINISLPFANGQTYDYGDVATFNYNGTVYIKRVIAKGGDTVEIQGDNLYVNKTKSPYNLKGNNVRPGSWVLEEDEYFMMGDNRVNSKDSRYIGPIKAKDMLGLSILTFFPLSSAKILLTEQRIITLLIILIIIIVLTIIGVIIRKLIFHNNDDDYDDDDYPDDYEETNYYPYNSYDY